MSNVKMLVDAGACMFKTTIEGSSDDGMTVSLKFDGGCPAVKKLASNMKEVNLFEAISTPTTENPVFLQCASTLTHACCPIPIAIVKICEAVGELALKKPVTLIYE